MDEAISPYAIEKSAGASSTRCRRGSLRATPSAYARRRRFRRPATTRCASGGPNENRCPTPVFVKGKRSKKWDKIAPKARSSATGPEKVETPGAEGGEQDAEHVSDRAT